MRKLLVILTGLLYTSTPIVAQTSAEAAHQKLLDLTKFFNGTEPYSCLAIVEVKYKGKSPIRDTSTLIYKNTLTYYKSRLVERLEGAEGELIVNHEHKAADFYLSDSVRRELARELKVESDQEFASILDSNFEARDLAYFNKYVINRCNAKWEKKDGVEELTFTPKNNGESALISMKLKFRDSTLLYYEYSYRDVYSSDMKGNGIFRIVTTIYDKFTYDNIPNIPFKLNDYLEWNDWTVKLKKHTNYKLSVL